MMEEKNKNRTRWLHLRLTPDEFEILEKRFKKSTCRKISEYARKNLMRKPVVLKYRNESLDELMRELILLRKELNAIGNNFNQAVKKLHTLSQISDFKYWILVSKTDKKKLFEYIELIQKHTQNLASKWLQS